MPYFDADAGSIMGEQIAATDTLLLGRLTYQIFAAFWPYAPEDDPMAKKLNGVPKYVVSTTLDKAEKLGYYGRVYTEKKENEHGKSNFGSDNLSGWVHQRPKWQRGCPVSGSR